MRAQLIRRAVRSLVSPPRGVRAPRRRPADIALAFHLARSHPELALIVPLFSRLDVNKNAKCVRVYARRTLAREGEEATTSVNDDDPVKVSSSRTKGRASERETRRAEGRDVRARARLAAVCQLGEHLYNSTVDLVDQTKHARYNQQR